MCVCERERVGGRERERGMEGERKREERIGWEEGVKDEHRPLRQHSSCTFMSICHKYSWHQLLLAVVIYLVSD